MNFGRLPVDCEKKVDKILSLLYDTNVTKVNKFVINEREASFLLNVAFTIQEVFHE